jgi:Fic family protein
MLEAVIQTSEYTTHKIARIRSLIAKTEEIIQRQKPQLAKIELPKLFEQPYIRPKNLMTEKIKSLNTAKKYLAELESLGLLNSSWCCI